MQCIMHALLHDDTIFYVFKRPEYVCRFKNKYILIDKQFKYHVIFFFDTPNQKLNIQRNKNKLKNDISCDISSSNILLNVKEQEIK